MGESRIVLPGLVAALLATAVPAAELARDYPNRPVRMLVPNGPGSSVDTLSRIIGIKLAEVIGQQVVIDNRAGAGGAIGMEIAKGANPDGYTLISAPVASTTIVGLLLKKPTYDPVRDYDYVGQFAVTPNVLVVNPGLPVRTTRELIDYAKAKQGQLNMASGGPGSQSHFSGSYLMQAGGFPSLHVPYKGGGPLVASVMAGESQWSLSPAPAVMTHVNAGRMRALGHSLPNRSHLLGDLPPIAQTIPGFDYSGWQGFLVPKGTPKALIDKLRAALAKTADMPETKALLAAQATEIKLGTPDEFRKVVQDSVEQNRRLVQALNLKGD